jgi:predicted RNA methylase/superfamily II DNA or RNA helicase
MLLIFKANQLGLFDKLVPVRASVSKQGVVTPAHTAIRKVRAPEAKPADHAKKVEAAHADVSAPAKPLVITGDLFAPRPAATAAPAEKPGAAEAAATRRPIAERLDRLAERRADPAVKPEPKPAPAEYVHPKRDELADKFEAKIIRQGGQAAARTAGEVEALRTGRFELAGDVGQVGWGRTESLYRVKDKPASAEPAPAPEPSEPAPAGGTDYAKPFDSSAAPDFGVKPGTSKAARLKLNARAAAMVGAPSDDLFAAPPKREPADPAILRQYSGNGGCGDSLNEFYTPAPVAAAMWHALTQLGMPENATALEPSCGPGVFLATAPAGVKVTGVEMDGTSAAIAAHLHEGHEIVHTALEGFARSDARQFDVVIGNAPFGDRGGLIRQDKKELGRAEAYFMDTALDKAKPGGLVAMIVPTSIMNGRNTRKLRERLLRKGEFLGAARMPNTAFEDSHTDVTTDVLFFRKRPQDVANALGVVPQETLRQLGVWDEDYLGGAYFKEGRGLANVFGTPGKAMRSFGEIDTVDGSMHRVPEAIAGLAFSSESATPCVEDILAATPVDERDRVRAAAGRAAQDTAKRGDTKVEDGVTYVLTGEPMRWHRVDEIVASKAAADAAALGDDIERAINGAPAGDLAERVKAYIEEHGLPSKNPDLAIAARVDSGIHRLLGAVKPDGTLSDIVIGRKADAPEASFDAAATSLASLDTGWFTPEMVAARWGAGDSEAALDHLYASPDFALDPDTGKWTSMDAFASGDLWPKLDRMRAVLAAGELSDVDRARVERQADHLEGLIDPKSLDDVEVALNSAFLPLGVVADFFNQRLSSTQTALTVHFDAGVYSVSGGGYGDSTLLSKYLNRSGVKEDEWATADLWNRDFKEWLCGSKHRDKIEDAYNRSFRGYRQKAYSTAPFDIPGLDATGLRPWIYSGIRQALEQRKGILADDVGLGKTVQGLILARMAKVTGQAKRPMHVVPKSVLGNWVAEAEKWFPGCKVLTIGETFTRDKNGQLKGKADDPAERNRKLHDLRQNDYDFIFVSQPAWNEIDLDPVTKWEMMEKDFWVQRGESLGNAGDKRIQAARTAYEQAKAKKDFSKRTDAIHFPDLGVDMLIGDEFHAYKNLFAAKDRRGESPKFLGGSGMSMRAQDTNLKARWLLENTGGDNVYGLTATPTKNSPLEVYSMLSHIAPEVFEARGIRNSEEFLDRYCEFERDSIINTQGAIVEALVTKGFKNLDELREIMRRFINRRTADDVGLELPARDDREHLVDMTAEQQGVYEHLREQAAWAALNPKDATGALHPFSIMSRMSKAAIDLELLDPATYAGAKSAKLDAAVANIVEGIKDGGQVVFAENVAVHGKLVKLLEAAGVPRNRIGIFNADEAESSTKRQRLSDDFNAGKLDVVIGNATMEEGVNLQKRSTDIHHIDLPWNASALQQRNGRALRQGNTKGSVRIHTYLSKGSFDSYRYQTIRAKKDWADLLWNGGDRVENLAKEGPVSRDEMTIMLAADPDAARAALTANRAAAQAKFEAGKYAESVEAFNRYSAMKRSLGALKQKGTESARRLEVKLGRARTALEADPWFKSKEALDAKGPVVLIPSNGEMVQVGTALDIPADAKMPGKYVVLGFKPSAEGVNIELRRYGQPTEKRWAGGREQSTMLVNLGDLNGGSTFPLDDAAEAAAFTEHMTELAQSKLAEGGLKSLKELHGVPTAAIEANYDALQKHAKEGAIAYTFDLGGHGNVGLVDSEGRPKSLMSYDAHKLLVDGSHDVMLPTTANREALERAWRATEDGKEIKPVWKAATSGRGSRSGAGEYQVGVVYPGGGYADSGTNKWSKIADNVFGKGTADAWKAAHDRAEHEKARHASSLGEALTHVARTATNQHANFSRWPRRGLATAYAKAKALGVRAAPFKDHAGKLPADVWGAGYGNSRQKVAQADTVHRGLTDLARHSGHHDLAAAMIVQGSGDPSMPGESPRERVKALLGLEANGRKGALAHMVAKHPEVGAEKVGDLTRIYASRPAYDTYSSATPAHPLYARFGERAHSMTVAELARHETEGHDDGGSDPSAGDERRAA